MQEYRYRGFSQCSEFPGDAKVYLQAAKLNNSKKAVRARTENEDDVRQWKTNAISHPRLYPSEKSKHIICGVMPQGIFTSNSLPNAKRLKGTGNVSVGVVVFQENFFYSTFSSVVFRPAPVLPPA